MEALYPAIDAALAQLHRLSPLVEKSYIRTPFLDPLVDHYSEAIGFEPTLLKVTDTRAQGRIGDCCLAVGPLPLLGCALIGLCIAGEQWAQLVVVDTLIALQCI